MTQAEEIILNELRELRLAVERLQNHNNRAKVPEASKRLGIGQAKLRELCKNGIIPSLRLNGDKKPQYVIDIAQAEIVLTRAGYLMKKAKKRGRKCTIDLTK